MKRTADMLKSSARGTVLVWLSLGAIAAVICIWVRSYFVYDVVQFHEWTPLKLPMTLKFVSIGSSRGALAIDFGHMSVPALPARDMPAFTAWMAKNRPPAGLSYKRWRWGPRAHMGFLIKSTDEVFTPVWATVPVQGTESWVAIPHWLVVASLAIGPAVWFWRCQRKRLPGRPGFTVGTLK